MPKPRRILYVQPNSEIGGSDICLLRMVGALDRSRYHPVVVIPADGPMTTLYQQAGAEVRFVPMRQLRTIPSMSYQSRYLFDFPGAVSRLKKLIVAEQIDAVHSNSLYCLYGALAARAARRIHLWHVREIPPAVPVAKPAFARVVRAMSHRILAMTQACLDSLWKRPPDHARVLYDGIDLAQYRADISGQRIRQELDIPPDAPLVGFVARLDPWKGLDVFLRAMQQVARQRPDAWFIVAGGAPKGFEDHERQMRTLATTLGIAAKVRFLGFRYGPADMPELMAALSVFVHTSVNPEPFGLVLIEAMAMARPLVAANAGGPREIVLPGQTGLLTPPGDADACATAVLQLLADPQLAAAMGTAARARVEAVFSRERFANDIHAIYDDVFAEVRP